MKNLGMSLEQFNEEVKEETRLYKLKKEKALQEKKTYQELK